jgi:hypothetical protein
MNIQKQLFYSCRSQTAKANWEINWLSGGFIEVGGELCWWKMLIKF